METIKKILILIFVALLVGGSAYSAFYFLKKYLNKTQETAVVTLQTSSQKDVPLAQEYPPGITAEWILEPGAVVIAKTQNLSNGAIQGTLLYESKISQKAATEGYEAFLKKRGWITLMDQNQKVGLYTINASKGTAQAFITIDQNDISKKVTVDVTVVGNDK